MTQDFLDALSAPGDAAGKWEQAGWAVGVEAAAPAAEDVDRNARFPHESLAALRQHKLLSALIPTEHGGGGATIAEVAGAVRALAFHCASSAQVLGMHSVEMINLVRHGTSEGMRKLLGEVATDQLLFANANSEVGIGGELTRSLCAVETEGDRRILRKKCLAISYGEYADAIAITARRTPDSEESDQLQAIVRRESLTLEPISDWDTMGLRGTCSRGFAVTAELDPDLIYPVPFATIAGTGSVPGYAIMHSAVWLGLAEAAAARAHAYVRVAARRSIGTVPSSAVRLAEMGARLQEGRDRLAATTARYMMVMNTDEVEDPGFMIAIRTLKVSTSQLAVELGSAALAICGITGFHRTGEYSVDRLIRDAHAGLIMGSNDRHINANAQVLIARKQM